MPSALSANRSLAFVDITLHSNQDSSVIGVPACNSTFLNSLALEVQTARNVYSNNTIYETVITDMNHLFDIPETKGVLLNSGVFVPFYREHLRKDTFYANIYV